MRSATTPKARKPTSSPCGVAGGGAAKAAPPTEHAAGRSGDAGRAKTEETAPE